MAVLKRRRVRPLAESPFFQLSGADAADARPGEARAAAAEADRGLSLSHICPLSEPKPGEFTVSIAENGGVCRVTEATPPRPRSRGSRRGRVCGFSQASRLRMLELVQSIDRTGVHAHWFTTHTVPAGEADWLRIEKLRRAWLKRFGRKWPRSASIVWKKDDHESGTVHLHGILLWLVPPPDLLAFRAWNDDAWADVVKSSNPAHRRVGCRIERVRQWNGIASYAAHYLGHEINELHAETGRIWGVYNRKLLPRSVRREIVSADVGKRIRRTFRRLRQSKRVRTLAYINGRWDRVKPYRHKSQVSGRWEQVSVEDQLSILRRWGNLTGQHLRTRCRRPKCCTTVPVQIWRQVVGDTGGKIKGFGIEAGEIEYHAYTAGRQFIEAGEAARCLQFFKGQEGRDNLPI